MNKTYSEKICLGTVQFGMDYGIMNKSGKIAQNEVCNILGYAHKGGIGTLDTASDYGSSEEAIGGFIKKNEGTYKVISKTSPVCGDGKMNLAEGLHRSLSRLNLESFYGYLIHSFDDFLNDPGMWDEMLTLKDRKFFQKAGFSIYKPEELEILFDKKKVMDIPREIFAGVEIKNENILLPCKWK